MTDGDGGTLGCVGQPHLEPRSDHPAEAPALRSGKV
jgi:hypothetical protein